MKFITLVLAAVLVVFGFAKPNAKVSASFNDSGTLDGYEQFRDGTDHSECF